MQSQYTIPDPGRSVLLTIDVQRDFTDPGATAEIPETSDRVPAMRRLVDAYRERRLPIVHAVRLYLADGTNVDLCRREIVEKGKAVVLPGSDGAELVEPLKPDPDVRTMRTCYWREGCKCWRRMSGPCTSHGGMRFTALLLRSTCEILP